MQAASVLSPSPFVIPFHRPHLVFFLLSLSQLKEELTEKNMNFPLCIFPYFLWVFIKRHQSGRSENCGRGWLQLPLEKGKKCEEKGFKYLPSCISLPLTLLHFLFDKQNFLCFWNKLRQFSMFFHSVCLPFALFPPFSSASFGRFQNAFPGKSLHFKHIYLRVPWKKWYW